MADVVVADVARGGDRQPHVADGYDALRERLGSRAGGRAQEDEQEGEDQKRDPRKAGSERSGGGHADPRNGGERYKNVRCPVDLTKLAASGFTLA